MKTRFGILFGLVTLALFGGVGVAAAAAPAASTGTQADTITPYSGAIGPGDSLYGLKIAFENLDESFTVNQSEKLEKQVSHAALRLAELKQELAENSTDTAEIVLDHYWQKLNQTEETLAPFPRNDTGSVSGADNTGLLQAREMITKHQEVLEDLLQSHPHNQGLARAYNNSIALEQKFEEKMEMSLHHQQEAHNGSFIPQQNMTLPGSGGWFGQDGNMTKPREGNQSVYRNGLDGNFTGNFLPGTNQSANRNGQEPNGPAGNQSAQDSRHQSDTAGNSGNNQNGIANNNQDNNNHVNQNTNNNRNAGSTKGNSNDNTNGNLRSPGR